MSLSPKGIAQLTNNGLHLKGNGIIPDEIIASPLRRTKESAFALAQPYDLPFSLDDNLLEVDMGEVEGLPVEFYEEVDGDFYTHPYADKPRSKESREEVVHRMMNSIHTITDKHKNGTAFIISHGDPISLVFWRLLHPQGDLPTGREMEQQNVYIPKGGMVRVVLDENHHMTEYEFITLEDPILTEGQNNIKERK